MYELKDYTNAINFTKEPLLDSEDEQWEKKYPSYIVNKCIAPFPDSVMLVNEINQLHHSFYLNNNYPNPFNPVTTLRYDLSENSLVTITIYDMLGRKVKTLINQTQDAGYRSVQWNATNDYGKSVSAGIYLYQIQAGEYISTKKMVLLK